LGAVITFVMLVVLDAFKLELLDAPFVDILVEEKTKKEKLFYLPIV
jgi:uncharacterized membrane protein